MVNLIPIILCTMFIVLFPNSSTAGFSLERDLIKPVTKPIKEVAEEVAKPIEEIAEEVAKPIEEVVEEVAKPVDKIEAEICRTYDRFEAEAKRVKDRVGSKVDRTAHKLEKEFGNLKDDWNHWREEKLDPLGDKIDFYIKALIDGANDGFPNGFGYNEQPYIPNPTFNIIFSIDYMNILVDEYMEQDIPLDDRLLTGVATNNYIHAPNTSIAIDGEKNLFKVTTSSGRMGFESSKIRGGFEIDGLELEIAPKIRITGNAVFLDLHSRLVYLDLDDVNPWIDRSIAQAVQKGVLNKNPICTIDLSDMIKINLTILNTYRHVTDQLSEASITMKNGAIVIEAKMKKGDISTQLPDIF